MKKIMIVFIILIILLNFSGCSASEEISKDYQYIENISNEIIRCFNERDNMALSCLFCNDVKSNYNLEEDIAHAFENYNGKAISYNITDKSAAEVSIRNGDYVKKLFIPHIENIVTDTEKQYTIGYSIYSVYENNINREGVVVIALYDGNDNLIATIGDIE